MISHSHVTPDLLAEAGYRYVLDWCMDDQPVWFRCRGGGRILAVPYPQEVNDIPQIVGRKIGGEAFADIVIDQFDEMLELSQERPLVMGVALHAYLVGQPHRLRHLKRALRHIARHRDRIWLTTPGAIARHCAELPEGSCRSPRYVLSSRAPRGTFTDQERSLAALGMTAPLRLPNLSPGSFS